MIVLLRPIISEKSMKLASVGEYTFEVTRDADKAKVKKAVQDKFKVDVLKVAVINTKGKIKMQKRVRKYYQTGGMKKAIVKVKEGQTIPLFESAKKEEEVVVQTAEGEPQVIKERKDILRRTKIKVERGAIGAAPTTQRKVITGK